MNVKKIKNKINKYMETTTPEQIVKEFKAMGVEFEDLGYTLLFEAIVGSQAHGTATPESDVDKKFVYCQNLESFLGFEYKPHEKIDKDHFGFEIGRFIELLEKADPTALELLFSPEDCIVYKHPVFDLLLEHKSKFLTKKCEKSFCGFAFQQIKRSLGYNKKSNWKEERKERKTVLDFCYVFEHGKSYPIQIYLDKYTLKQEYCGLTKIDHMPNCYGLFYDYSADPTHSTITEPKGYKGIVGDDSNDVRLSSIPKGEVCFNLMYFNKDAYSIHCKEYREYVDWDKKKNENRYAQNLEHGQQYDSKNVMHCRRIVNLCMEIPTTKHLQVRRPPQECEYLLRIKKGKENLHEIVSSAEKDLSLLHERFQNSNLPEMVDEKLTNLILTKIRKKVYGLHD